MAAVDPLLRGYALTTAQGSIGFCAVSLVTTVGADRLPRRILFDTGHAGRRRALLKALCQQGLTPADIDVVVLSHAHWDHVQNADLFAAATVLLHGDEFVYAQSPAVSDAVTPSWTSALLRHVDAHAVGGDEALGVDVHTMHLPGHTPGSLGLVVRTPDGVHVLTGDAVASAGALERRKCAVVHDDSDRATQSIDMVATLADVVWPGHGPPFEVVDGLPA